MESQGGVQNRLFPVFLKLEALHTLLVGGGNVALEKLSALLKNSPEAVITVVAGRISDEIRALAADHRHVFLKERDFRARDLQHQDVVILATDSRELHERIRRLARRRHLLINVADVPDLCDFYLGATVSRGNLKVGISTNGLSPTAAKRMREFFDEVLPETIDELIHNLHRIRDRINGDLKARVARLNDITSTWLKKH